MERPLRYSWILPDRLAVGERPQSYSQLQSLGFRAVLSLQEEDESDPEGEAPPEGFYQRVPIRDGIRGGVPSTLQISRAVEAISGFLGKGLRTYVHCYAGVGRSPTICMAFLARHELLSSGEAFRRILEAHPSSGPSPGQLAALVEYLKSMDSA